MKNRKSSVEKTVETRYYVVTLDDIARLTKVEILVLFFIWKNTERKEHNGTLTLSAQCGIAHELFEKTVFDLIHKGYIAQKIIETTTLYMV